MRSRGTLLTLTLIGADLPLIETPEGDYERKLAIEEARRALDKIKEPMRSCLILKQQGLSYREIARSLSLSETTAVSMVSQGRKQFETAYQSFGGSIGVGSIAKDLDDVHISTESVLLEDSERERLSARLDDLLPKINKIQSSLESDQFEIEELREKTRSILALLPAQ